MKDRSQLNLTPDEWQQFKGSAVGEKILKQLSEIRMSILDNMAHGGCLTEDIGLTAMNSAYNSGEVFGIEILLDYIPLEPEDEEV